MVALVTITDERYEALLECEKFCTLYERAGIDEIPGVDDLITMAETDLEAEQES